MIQCCFARENVEIIIEENAEINHTPVKLINTGRKK